MKILIVDDHKLFVDGLVSIVGTIPGVTDVFNANNAQEALSKLHEVSIDIALIDIHIPNSQCSGIELAEIIKKKFPTTKCLMVSMDKKPAEIEKLMQLGIEGYLLKDSGKVLLMSAIRSISNGKEFWDDNVLSAMRTYYATKEIKQAKNKIIQLTGRERDVLLLVAAGLATKEIAIKLAIAKTTVDYYRKNILIKFEVANCTAAVLKAKENGII